MRTATWSNIGTEIVGAKRVDDVLRQANLDYEVELRHVFMGDGSIIPNSMVSVRTSDNHPFGIVSPKYEVVQNVEAFDFVNHLSDDIVIEKAGETEQGMVYIIGRLPDVSILGDTFTPHLIFRNGFAGNYTIAAAICPLRIVCQNQFNFAFKHTTNTISIRHMASAKMKIEEAQNTLKYTYEYMEKLDAFAENYASRKLSEKQIRWVVDMMFPMKEEGTKGATMMERAKQSFLHAYNADDNYSFRGTAWGMINAYSDYLTHQDIKGEETQKRLESRFRRVTMMKPMNQIVDVIENVA